MADDTGGEPEEKRSEDREQPGEAAQDESQRFSRLGQQHAQQIVQEAWREAEEVIARSQEKAAEIIENSRREADEVLAERKAKADDAIKEARKQADEAAAEGQARANAAIEEARKLADEVGRRIEQEAKEQAEVILADARQEAEDLVRRAGEDLNKQLKEKTKDRREKLLAEAREEADGIIAAAKEEAEKEGRRIVGELQRETQQRLEQETVSFKSYAQAQADEIRSDTEKRAARLLRAIDEDSRRVNGLLADSLKKYEDILGRLKEDVQNEVGEIAKDVTAARKDIENKLTSYTADSESEDAAMPSVKPSTGASFWITLGEPMSDDGLNLYKGRLDLKTLSVVEHRKVRSLKAFLSRVQNVKYVGESSNDEGTVLSFEITEPMPLMEILDNVPDVITSEQSGNNIKLTLN
jgi:F0F1-type ATP synthase membrane subunit b/b'